MDRLKLRSRMADWHASLTDRARILALARFVGHRFLRDRLFEAAGSLAYTTVFALVPLATVIFAMLSAFEMFSHWREQLSGYIFQNFVPSSARALEGYLLEYSNKASALTTLGVVVLVISVLITLTSVEAIFNRIWRVPTSRPKLGRFLVYWTVLTLGTLFATAALALSARVFAMAIFNSTPGRWLEEWLLQTTPFLIELAIFATLYRVVPHRTIKWRHALAGALLGAIGFELVKWGLGIFLGSFNTYERIYGSVALLPVILLWIYLSWVAVLLGASFASSLSAFRYQPASLRLPEGFEIYGILRILGRFHSARKASGQGLGSDSLRQLDPILTDNQVQDMLGKLAHMQIIQRSETGEWLLARDLQDVSLAEIYRECQLRIPIEAPPCLPCQDDPQARRLMQLLAELRTPLEASLQRPVASLYQEAEETP